MANLHKKNEKSADCYHKNANFCPKRVGICSVWSFLVDDHGFVAGLTILRMAFLLSENIQKKRERQRLR
jgi:hypothetical protein